jgi:CheY-like chemotaxis protein
LHIIDVLENAIEAIRPAAEAKQIRLQVLLDPSASPVAGDADRLRQIFWNLLSNAVKFTPKNGRGQGANFIIKLPILIAATVGDGEERVHPVVEEIAPWEGGPSLKNLRVLVVDDETGAREVVATILEQAEAEVSKADSAIQALEIMDHWRPDVLVADIGMPDIDGYEFIRRVRLRSPQTGGAVPAAALTAYARTQDRLRVLSAGFQMHIPKPIQPAELTAVVASLAKRLI